MSGSLAHKSQPDFTFEKKYNGPVCGIDEVGRGPLAGPVLAACVHIPKKMQRRRFLAEVRDSKKLSARKREVLFLQIREHTCFGIGMASPEEIDTLNIHHATLLAMRRACHSMLNDFEIKPDAALVDGKFIPDLPLPHAEALVKGDNRSLSIASASILAKVTRDRIMARLHNDHPVYGWDHNAGYGTAQHLAGIKEHGITDYHRRSFSPIKGNF